MPIKRKLPKKGTEPDLSSLERIRVNRIIHSMMAICVLERLYESTENPLCAWRAWAICSAEEITLPRWVVAYLNMCSEALMEVAMHNIPKENIAGTAGVACQFGGKAKGDNSFKLFHEFIKGAHVSADLAKLDNLAAGKRSEIIAAAHGTTPLGTWRYARDFLQVFGLSIEGLEKKVSKAIQVPKSRKPVKRVSPRHRK